jgi:Tfp pilus assembly protein PilO
MNRLNPRLLIPVGVGVLVLLLWFVVLWGPQGSALSRAKKRADTAEQQRDTLQDQLTRLKASKRDEPLKRSQLETLRVAVPDDPNLAQFILDANDAASRSGIEFLSITPTPPSQSGGGTPSAAGAPPAVKLSMNITGGYFQVLDFVNRLDRLPRIVVIDGMTLSGSQGGQLTAQLTARMFVSAVKPVAGSTGAAGTTGSATGSTTTSTAVPGATTTSSVAGR